MQRGDFDVIFGDLQGRWIVGEGDRNSNQVADIWYSSQLHDSWKDKYSDSRSVTGLNHSKKLDVDSTYDVEKLTDPQKTVLKKTRFQCEDSSTTPYYCSYALYTDDKTLCKATEYTETMVGYCDFAFTKKTLSPDREEDKQREVLAQTIHADIIKDLDTYKMKNIDIWDYMKHNGFVYIENNTAFVSFNLGGKRIKRLKTHKFKSMRNQQKRLDEEKRLNDEEKRLNDEIRKLREHAQRRQPQLDKSTNQSAIMFKHAADSFHQNSPPIPPTSSSWPLDKQVVEELRQQGLVKSASHTEKESSSSVSL